MTRHAAACLLAVLLSGMAGCGAPDAPDAPGYTVFVTVPPQAYLVEQLAGNRARAEVLVPANEDPHTYEPAPRQVMALGKARLYFRIGVPLEEPLLAKIAGAPLDLRIVDTTEGIAWCAAGGEEHDHDLDHGHGHGHSHEADPHVWLGPPQLAQVARNMTRAFVETDPEHAAEYEALRDAFLSRLDAVHTGIARRLEPFRGRTFFVYHPAFDYFAETYGLRQRAVEMGGRQPEPRDLQRLIAQARAESVKVVFVQPQFPKKSAEAVAAAIGGVAEPMDPMAHDILANFEAIAGAIERALKD